MLENKTISRIVVNNMLAEMAMQGSLKGVKIFITKGADITPRSINEAITGNHLEVVKYLVDNGAIITDQAVTNVAKYGHLKMVKFFSEKGADKIRMLIDAVYYGHLDIVKWLIENTNLNINALTNYASSGALGLAFANNHLKIAKYLVEHGADIHIGNDYIFQISHLLTDEMKNYIKSLVPPGYVPLYER